MKTTNILDAALRVRVPFIPGPGFGPLDIVLDPAHPPRLRWYWASIITYHAPLPAHGDRNYLGWSFKARGLAFEDWAKEQLEHQRARNPRLVEAELFTMKPGRTTERARIIFAMPKGSYSEPKQLRLKLDTLNAAHHVVAAGLSVRGKVL